MASRLQQAAEDEHTTQLLEALDWAVAAARDARKTAISDLLKYRRGATFGGDSLGRMRVYEGAVDRVFLLEVLVDRVRHGECR